MALGKQEVFRERTFGSYPTVHEIRRAQRRTERDSLVRLLRNSARQRSSLECHELPSVRGQMTSRGIDEEKRSRLVNLLYVSHDRGAGGAVSQLSPRGANRDTKGKLPPINDLHLKTLAPPARNGPQGPSSSSATRSRNAPSATGSGNDPFRKVENTDTHFQKSKSSVRRHFWISPDWLSEGLTIKRLQLENRSDPMKFGWI